MRAGSSRCEWKNKAMNEYCELSPNAASKPMFIT